MEHRAANRDSWHTVKSKADEKKKKQEKEKKDPKRDRLGVAVGGPFAAVDSAWAENEQAKASTAADAHVLAPLGTDQPF